MSGARVEAWLLLGPTGSGKTPLGQMLQARGLAGRRCLHFDFGHGLRAAVQPGNGQSGFSAGEIEFLKGVRTDDDLPSVERKLAIYTQRTAPLIEFYRRRAVPIIPLEVTADTTPEAAWQTLQQKAQMYRTSTPSR